MMIVYDPISKQLDRVKVFELVQDTAFNVTVAISL